MEECYFKPTFTKNKALPQVFFLYENITLHPVIFPEYTCYTFFYINNQIFKQLPQKSLIFKQFLNNLQGQTRDEN